MASPSYLQAAELAGGTGYSSLAAAALANAQPTGAAGDNDDGTYDSLMAGAGVRAVVRSYETAAIGSELNGVITYLPTREGDRFLKGDVIVEFDCRKFVAEHDRAVAAAKARKAAFESLRQMLRYKATGTLAVEQARFEMEMANADVRGLAAKLTGCTVIAPFNGRVAEKLAQAHEVAQPNQTLIKIINEEKLELVVMVPSKWIAKLVEGTPFSFRVDETGEIHKAIVVQSTGVIDPVSQTARLIAEIARPSASLVAGMSGTAVFSSQEASQ